MRRFNLPQIAAGLTQNSSVGPILAKCTLVLFFITLAVVNKSDRAWPAVSWPMFSSKTVTYPGDIYEADLIKAIDVSGHEIWIRSGDLWGNDRYQIVDKMIVKILDTSHPKCAVHRSSLFNLIRFEYSQHDLERVEIWKLTWSTELDKNPPLHFDTPNGATLLASYTKNQLIPDSSFGDSK
jgi:hypothetical protein